MTFFLQLSTQFSISRARGSGGSWRVAASGFHRRLCWIFFVLSLALEARAGAEERTQDYQLPAGDAEVTLATFVRQSREQIIYAPAAVKGEKTTAVNGRLTARAALEQMLAGTLLSVREDDKTGALTIKRDVTTKTDAAPRRPLASAAAEGSQETVQLEKLRVNSTPERGYAASGTTAGPRVETAIQDLPFSVNVLTKEFFEDFGIFEFDDTLTQIGGLTGLDIEGAFHLRGFSSTFQLRDGFFRLGRNGVSNVDRIEVIKGPNAGIYGRTSPGGMINMVSKQPQKTPTEELKLVVGDYNTRVATFEVTGSVASHTSYVLTLSRFERDFDVAFAHLRNDEAYLAVRRDFADGSKLQVSAEYFLQLRRAPTSAAPVVTDWHGTSVGPGEKFTALGYAKSLARINAFGPNSELNRGDATFLASYERSLNPVWHVRATAQYFRARRWDYNQNTDFDSITINKAGVNTPATGAIVVTRGLQSDTSSPDILTPFNPGIPTKNIRREDGGGFQGDVSAHYWLGNHVVENRTLLTFDFNDYYRDDRGWFWGNPNRPYAQPELTDWSTANTIALNPDFSPIGPVAYFPKPFEWAHAFRFGSARRRTEVFGGLFRHESHWARDRLLTYVGGRFDQVRFREKWIEDVHRDESEFKPNLGALYKITPAVRVYANHSESYFVNQGSSPGFVSSPDYRPETARGYDYGVKGVFLHDRLNFTLGGYYIERFNVPIVDDAAPDPTIIQFKTTERSAGNQLDRGFEFDLSWRLGDKLSAMLSFAHTHAIYTAFGTSQPRAIGRSVQAIAPENGSFALKYSARPGHAGGFSANLGVTYVATTPTELPYAGDVYAISSNGAIPRTFLAESGQWNLKVPSFTLWNLGLRYGFNNHARLSHTLALNINNVFDHEYLKVSKQWGDRRALYLTYRIEARQSP